jgi:hypothetical protein
MRENITLSTGRTVYHRPYLSNGKPNGATEAYISESVTLNGVEFKVEKSMTDDEWKEYCTILHAKNT